MRRCNRAATRGNMPIGLPRCNCVAAVAGGAAGVAAEVDPPALAQNDQARSSRRASSAVEYRSKSRPTWYRRIHTPQCVRRQPSRTVAQARDAFSSAPAAAARAGCAMTARGRWVRWPSHRRTYIPGCRRRPSPSHSRSARTRRRRRAPRSSACSTRARLRRRRAAPAAAQRHAIHLLALIIAAQRLRVACLDGAHQRSARDARGRGGAALPAAQRQLHVAQWHPGVVAAPERVVRHNKSRECDGLLDRPWRHIPRLSIGGRSALVHRDADARAHARAHGTARHGTRCARTFQEGVHARRRRGFDGVVGVVRRVARDAHDLCVGWPGGLDGLRQPVQRQLQPLTRRRRRAVREPDGMALARRPSAVRPRPETALNPLPLSPTPPGLARGPEAADRDRKKWHRMGAVRWGSCAHAARARACVSGSPVA